MLLVFQLRSLRLALLSLVPNLVPLLWVLVAMAFFEIDLNVTTGVIFTIAFGIAVDDTLHFLAGLHERRRGSSPLEAIRATLRETGAALVLTTVVLGFGFLVLCISNFRTNRYLGALVALTLGFALLCDLLVLPALLSLGLGRDAGDGDREGSSEGGEAAGAIRA